MKYLIKFLMSMTLVTISLNVSAVPIGTVGSYDAVKAQDSLGNSSIADEEAWIEGVLGEGVDYTKLGSSGSGAWEDVVGGAAGDYAFDFGAGAGPAYYLVKVGGGKGTGTTNTHFLFENAASLQWGFVNTSFFGNVKIENIGIISHVGITGPGTSVAAPAPLVVMAIGLMGMLGLGRFRKVS
jgi:hypothetical protein